MNVYCVRWEISGNEGVEDSSGREVITAWSRKDAKRCVQFAYADKEGFRVVGIEDIMYGKEGEED